MYYNFLVWNMVWSACHLCGKSPLIWFASTVCKRIIYHVILILYILDKVHERTFKMLGSNMNLIPQQRF